MEERKIGLDLARRVRPLHLHRDAVAVRQHRPVHLADRRSGHRHFLELEERLLDRQTELGLDRPLDVGVRYGPHVVLELLELDEDVRGHDVGARREQLAELDERRPELVEHLAQVASALRALAVPHRRELLVPGQEVGQPVALEEVAEPVPDRDLRDLAQAAEIALLLRARRHRLSVTRWVT